LAVILGCDLSGILISFHLVIASQVL